MLLASDVHPLVFGNNTPFDEEKWTAKDLGMLARTDKLSAVVSRVTNAAYDSGAPAVLQIEG